MNIINKVADMQKISKHEKQQEKTIGFVPTMGYLHEGHQQLIKKARASNDIVVLSIFVNPLQFGPNEDFEAYPRNMERDEEIAHSLGVDYLFYPTITEMYNGERTTIIKVQKRVDVLCGKHRPGHFDGVATVVMKLFQIVMPDSAYFGMKDAQQVAVIEGLINDYHLQVELIRVDTIREEDGLAKSSRNVYLNDKERLEAPYIYRALTSGKEKFLQEMSVSNAKDQIFNFLSKNTSGEIEYIEVLSYPALEPISSVKPGETAIIALALKFSKARLIDNIVFSY
ncbi:pantoate--beta-alanine ligase [Sutcliffiella rhizosphaerae]|uniref:Pantothenate synthetase n=1 Tax=Sutcliffiella rhizosphaerae TaxID=2880967 RepID=A0ABM8YRJ4_9BACI|nr:pantoate--beta-alanine ligase [Sutcliffiella rhizosphaerae]CAG9622625.1 Pantothenate synthetase [Sutcliffiella rhizosphaerae]